jgi:hypothetical protein
MKSKPHVKRRDLLAPLAAAAAAGALLPLASREAEARVEAQPHMRAALNSLQAAKNQLQRATHDKGGHRVKAIQLVDQAIGEVQAGIRFDNRN